MPAGIEFRVYQGLASLPHFNPDLDIDEAHPDGGVRVWRDELRAADAIVICTPEYARGVPGSLKNALDWVVSSGEFMNMPTAIISGSPHPDGGVTALHSLKLTLEMMNAYIPEEALLTVPSINKIFGQNGSLIDTNILSSMLKLVRALSQAIPNKK
jgi:NAD(P)H-dependent FMN reductase